MRKEEMKVVNDQIMEENSTNKPSKNSHKVEW